MKKTFIIGCILFAFQFSAANAKNQSFACTAGVCTCDPNVTGDCDAMKKNCVGGDILICGGVFSIRCTCNQGRSGGQKSLKKIPNSNLKVQQEVSALSFCQRAEWQIISSALRGAFIYRLCMARRATFVAPPQNYGANALNQARKTDTVEALTNIAATTLENISDFEKGLPLKNAVRA